jgi:hypothetical protein
MDKKIDLTSYYDLAKKTRKVFEPTTVSTKQYAHRNLRQTGGVERRRLECTVSTRIKIAYP